MKRNNCPDSRNGHRKDRHSATQNHPTQSALPVPRGKLSYGALVRRAILFQFRLAADGLRDLALSPIAIFAALLGILNPSNPSWAFDRLMMTGRETDRWINLFEQEDPDNRGADSHTIDDLFEHMEQRVKEKLDENNETPSDGWAESLGAALRSKNEPL